MSKSNQSHSVHTIEEAMAALGVNGTSLTRHEKDALDRLGYVIFCDVLSADRVAALRRSFDEMNLKSQAPGMAQKETGTRHVKDLHREESFWRVCVQPRILAAAFHVLKRRFVCSFPHGREPLRGFGQQGLHMDWRTAAIHNQYFVASALCLLDDFTADNGATRVVPGSHRRAALPDRTMADPAFVHRDQIIVTAAAGSVLFFNGHLLHSGTRNAGSLRRRVLQFSFTAQEVVPPVTGATEFGVTDPAVRYVFGYSTE
jgi:ectoine hydroxylase-related dioxygenase (phytanoyl-CoA dioxygenase family)